MAQWNRSLYLIFSLRLAPVGKSSACAFLPSHIRRCDTLYLSTMRIKGEYWIKPNAGLGAVDVVFADGSAGNQTHESIAFEAVRRELLDVLDYKGDTGGDIQSPRFLNRVFENFCLIQELPLPNHPQPNDYEKAVRLWMQRNCPGNLWLICDFSKDLRNAVSENWGWKTVHGNNIGTWSLTRDDFNKIATGIAEIVDQQWTDSEDEEDLMESLFIITVGSTGKMHRVTFQDFEDRNFGICVSSSDFEQPERCDAVSRMDEDLMASCYSRVGD